MSDGVRWNLGNLRIWRKRDIGERLGKPFGVIFAVKYYGHYISVDYVVARDGHLQARVTS